MRSLTPIPKSSRIATILTGIAILSIPLSSAANPSEETKAPKEESAPKTSFPALDILPAGSILKRVRLPRYDKNFNPNSLLTADQLTVVNGHRIDGVNVSIELYDQYGKVQVHSDMKQAIYDQEKSTLHASEAISLRGEKYTATGTGMIFHLMEKRGFLLGPAVTLFDISPTDTSSAMFTPRTQPARPTTPRHLQKKQQPLVVAATLITLTTCALATPPERLTETQLTKLTKLTQPGQTGIQAEQQEVTTSLAQEQKLNASANATMRPFLQKIGQGNLVAQNTVTTPPPHTVTPPPDQTTQTTGSAQKKQPNSTATGATQAKPTDTPPQLLRIECDGGLYFDTDTGILAYLKNIRLTEPRFKLTCSDELKVFLDKKEDPAKKKSDQGAKKDSPPTKESETTDKQANSPTNSFGDLKQIIAIGKVRVVSKDDKGKVFIATAETAIYNAKTGEMILRGGLPRIQYGPNQYLQSQAPGQYIRMLKNGKLVTTGKWATQIDTSKKNTPSKKQK